jgi:Putative DNA-binding domain
MAVEDNTSEFSLEGLQRWLQAVIAHPAGVVAGLRSSAAQQSITMEPSDLENIVTRSEQLTSVERLEIYARAYYARLLECLKIDFPMFAKAVGEDLFQEFAVGYLNHYPSRSYTLHKLGDRLGTYLEESRPTRDNDTLDWTDLLIELVRFEWLLGEVFDGPGSESQTSSFHELTSLSPEMLAAGRLICSPSLKLCTFRFPVNHYWEELRKEVDPPFPAPQTTYVALSRSRYIVRRYDLSQAEYGALQALQQSQTVEAALQVALEFVDDEANLQEMVTNWFAQWRQREWLIAFEASPADGNG